MLFIPIASQAITGNYYFTDGREDVAGDNPSVSLPSDLI
jgi:hypothetical protein